MKIYNIISILSLMGITFGASIKVRDGEDPHPNPLEEKKTIQISDKIDLEPAQFVNLGAKRVKVRYGPLVVPGIRDPETMGMKSFEDPIEMPCRDCLITAFVAGLEFKDGSNANAAEGMWLHHTAFLNANQTDTTCPDFPSRFIASGNERTPIDLTQGGKYKAGLYIGPNDTIVQATELMNESALERAAYLTVEWEYIPADTPGFAAAKTIWLDVSGLCSNTSAVEVDISRPIFSKMMIEPYTIDFDAELLANLGHLHDGGTHQTVYVNGWQVCDHVATYGGTEEFITHVGMYGHEDGEDHDHDDMDEHEHEHNGAPHHDKRQHDHGGEEHEEHDHSTGEHIPHISNISYCTYDGTFKKGDKLSITSFYDLTAHKAMAGHHGGFEPVMGITLFFVLPKVPDVDFIIESDK